MHIETFKPLKKRESIYISHFKNRTEDRCWELEGSSHLRNYFIIIIYNLSNLWKKTQGVYSFCGVIQSQDGAWPEHKSRESQQLSWDTFTVPMDIIHKINEQRQEKNSQWMESIKDLMQL